MARDLKYYSPDTNYGALANELHNHVPSGESSPVSPEIDKWAEYLDDDESDDEYESDETSSRSA